MPPQRYQVTTETTGAVLGALRKHATELTWSAARKHLNGHRITVNGILCVDEGRRVVAGDLIEIRTQPLPPPPRDEDIQILHLDAQVVVVNKPAGMLSLRHPADVKWRQERRDLQPSLEECLTRLISRRESRRDGNAPELLAVHRIDRETSGVLAFARTESAQVHLIEQFATHSSFRRYLCVVPGHISAGTIQTSIVRDRGDGLRGSASDSSVGKHAVTHVNPLRKIGNYTELECQLETGRTNQIRIHLAELRHPICGDVKYRGPFGEPPITDDSRAPRLVLHAANLGFIHPLTGQNMKFSVPLPKDLQQFFARLEKSALQG
ncbi:MAG TPA: RluA family pseudouridine synthase [Planctomycetaceae bacterium]|nr:RluA family pseudouridine synthase [Planctomycetaceae bacterium]HQZ64268.1 RluA family pseudouridine synthase [Planctomycetaceae bacterium]